MIGEIYLTYFQILHIIYLTGQPEGEGSHLIRQNCLTGLAVLSLLGILRKVSEKTKTTKKEHRIGCSFFVVQTYSYIFCYSYMFKFSYSYIII